jgi:hypothetical protein
MMQSLLLLLIAIIFIMISIYHLNRKEYITSFIFLFIAVFDLYAAIEW